MHGAPKVDAPQKPSRQAFRRRLPQCKLPYTDNLEASLVSVRLRSPTELYLHQQVRFEPQEKQQADLP